MLKNYLKTAFRNLLKNKAFTFINILGVAIGMAACLLILQYAVYELNYDKFHKNAHHIYRIQYNFYQNGQQTFACAAAVPAVGPAMKDNFPEVVEFARFFPVSGIMTYFKPDGTSLAFREEKMQVANSAALAIFSFPLIEGNSETALEGSKHIVISESAAKRYFGEEDPVGKTLHWQDDIELLVTGVMRDVPKNSHIKFDFLISYQSITDLWGDDTENSWGWYDFNTYVLLNEGTDPKTFQAKWDAWLIENRKAEWEKHNFREEFVLQPLTDIHLYSNLLQESEPEEQGNGEAVYFLLIIAAFILLIAWVNYVNLSTARSVERANEVGVRKALGAIRKQLVGQVIFESVLVNLMAAVLAFLLVTLALPFLADLTGRPLSFAWMSQAWFWLTLLGLFIIGAVLSGLYPAFMLSGFKPITVLRGKINTSPKGILLRKGLVVFQFGASVALIAGTLIVYRQIDYMMNRDLGVNINQTLVLRGPGVTDSLYSENLNTFKTEVLRNTQIQSFTGASNVPGDEIFWTRGIHRLSGGPESATTIYNLAIDYDYVPAFELQMAAGRNFSREFGTDRQAVLLNEAAARVLAFQYPEEALQQQVNLGGDTLTIVGVLEDYHQMSLKTTQAPMAFRLNPDAGAFYALKIQTENMPETLSAIQSKWDEFFPGNPFEYFFLDEFFNRQYQSDQVFGRVFSVFAGLAIFVACLGLFGLASFTTIQRTKEIGVRKVLGASVISIVGLLTKDFVKLILIANLIALPLAYYIMSNWLSGYPFRVNIGWWMFVFPLLTVILIAILTVSFQTIRAAMANPVKSLRYE